MVKPGLDKIRRHPHPLARKAGVRHAFFITDFGRARDPLAIAKQLPAGSFVILRDYELSHERREMLAKDLRKLTKARRQYLLIAGDATLALKVKADGVHLPEYWLSAPPLFRQFRFLSAACHSIFAVKRALDLNVDFLLVSPIFKTGSHEGVVGRGIHRLGRLLRHHDAQYVALGGVNQQTAMALKTIKGLDGVAAISAFERRRALRT